MVSMERLKIFPILRILLALVVFGAVCARAECQGTPESARGSKVRVVPAEQPIPFSTDSDVRVDSIEFRTEDQMTRTDSDLAADAQSSISEHAGFMDLEFNQGKWTYEQVVCAALPNHLFLRFRRNNGTGDVTVFSASIPRGGEGRVRIVPILLRGYSLFSPAPINALTVSAFNHIRAEEHFDTPPDWLRTGLCYAALAGGHPRAALMPAPFDSEKFPLAKPAMLETSGSGAVVSFADLAAAGRPMEWTMTFDHKGKLLKAAHRPAAMIPTKVNHPQPLVEKVRNVPAQ